jgi:hypothetical protein
LLHFGVKKRFVNFVRNVLCLPRKSVTFSPKLHPGGSGNEWNESQG